MQQNMKIGNRVFDLTHHTYIMAILNMTPDSFSDGGSYATLDDALYRVEQMLAEGADVIDVGGESTRPGHAVIGDEEEIQRVTPVIEAITKRFDVPVSIDTYKSAVAKAALQSGAHMVNDIWGLQHDPAMAGVIAQAGAACCLMHNQQDTRYDNLLLECLETLRHHDFFAFPNAAAHTPMARRPSAALIHPPLKVCSTNSATAPLSG